MGCCQSTDDEAPGTADPVQDDAVMQEMVKEALADLRVDSGNDVVLPNGNHMPLPEDKDGK